MSKKIQLSEMLDHISSELLIAQKKADERGQSTMQFSECEIEFAVETTKEASGGIKVWISELKAGAKKTDSNTIRIKFGSIPGYSIQAAQKQKKSTGPELKKQ
ncbi:MAG: trypco2 family protein [Cyclobacteriaceae bacterium]